LATFAIPTSTADTTTTAVLSMLALAIWMMVLPLEILFRAT
jgi:hypothetical protein